MRKEHVSETVASKAVWLCDESHSHSGDESKISEFLKKNGLKIDILSASRMMP
jgi:hypothetical protein